MKRFLLVCSILLSIGFFLKWGKTSFVFYGDALGYYYYLPSALLYHNMHQIDSLPTDKGIEPAILNYAKEFRLTNPSPKGYYINQYTYGVALMELPFFAIAHGYEYVTHGNANGFSNSYQWMIKFSSILFVILGLWLTYRILSMLYNKNVAFYTCIILLMGTNLFWFTFYQSGMAHTPLFFLFSLLIFSTIRIHQHPSLKYFILIGFSAGLITIMRPTDIICILIPLGYGVYSIGTFQEKYRFLLLHRYKLIWTIGCFILPILPQLVLWKMLSGHFLYYSYGQQSFDFLHPKILKGLLHPMNGWLIYSPVFLLSMFGMFRFTSMKQWLIPIWIFTPIYIYIIYSWHCYNYINGLGSRPMINIYPLLAIPMAAFLNTLFINRTRLYNFTITILILFLIAVSASYHLQAVHGILWSENSNWQFNKQTFFRYKLNYQDLVVLDTDSPQPYEASLSFVRTLVDSQFVNKLDSSKHYFSILKGEEYPTIKIQTTYKSSLFKEATWLKCIGRFNTPEVPADWYNTQLMVLDIKHGQENKLWNKISINNKIGYADQTCLHNEIKLAHFETKVWSTVYFFIKIPNNIQDGDEINLSIWNIAKKPLLVDSLSIQLYEEKP